MILHDFTFSSASYRVRIALNFKQIAYETRTYQLRAGEQRAPNYLAINPAGLIPTLEIDGLKITQSLAIIDYLDTTRRLPLLIPTDPTQRAHVLAMALTIACDIHPLNNLRVLAYLENTLRLDKKARDDWYAEWISHGFHTLESTLRTTPQTLYASADSPGLVDVCLVPQVYNARRFKVDLSAYPRLVEVADRAAALPAFAAAAPPP